VSPLGSIAVGAGASVFCYAAVALIKPKFGYDDSLDVFGVHGVGGAWGAIAAALFIADWGVQDGVSYGGQIVTQLISVGFTAVFAGGLTMVILVVLKMIFGDLRVSTDGEHIGLDITEHSETAYSPPS
jgi:Amt family ammonium transporter